MDKSNAVTKKVLVLLLNFLAKSVRGLLSCTNPKKFESLKL